MIISLIKIIIIIISIIVDVAQKFTEPPSSHVVTIKSRFLIIV